MRWAERKEQKILHTFMNVEASSTTNLRMKEQLNFYVSFIWPTQLIVDDDCSEKFITLQQFIVTTIERNDDNFCEWMKKFFVILFITQFEFLLLLTNGCLRLKFFFHLFFKILRQLSYSFFIWIIFMLVTLVHHYIIVKNGRER